LETNCAYKKKEIHVKTSFIRTLAILVGATLGPICLMAQSSTMTVKIPFDFTVGSTSFTAGDYTLRPQLAHDVLSLQSADDRSAIMALTLEVQSTKRVLQATLVFNRYGDRYFLSQVWSPGHIGRQLEMSAREKEILAKLGTPKPVVIIASSQ
jgi:hypothetical protein